jgi:hypothetical protein
MFGASYFGQSYFAQGYPITGATIPTGVYAIDVLGVDGSLVARIGDIGNLPWGASGKLLPPGTWGLWGKRSGVWLEQHTQVFYANADTITTQPVSNASYSAPGAFVFNIDETLPFQTITVPDGRMVSWEDFVYFTTITVVSAPGVTSPAVVAFSVLPSVFYATKDASLIQAWNFMTGPTGTGSGTSVYTNIFLRRAYTIQVSGTGSGIWTFNVQRRALLRMFAHEVNSKPTGFGSFVSFTASGTVTQTPNIGADRDPGGGSGVDPGGYVGGGGGGGAGLLV